MLELDVQHAVQVHAAGQFVQPYACREGQFGWLCLVVKNRRRQAWVMKHLRDPNVDGPPKMLQDGG